MTNGDKIRSMSDEELVKFINNIKGECSCIPCYYDKHWIFGGCGDDCNRGRIKWLESEAE